MSDKSLQNSSADLEISTFCVGEALFGIDLVSIQEINKHVEVTNVQKAPEYIEGILNLRGQIVTIIDLGKKLGLSPVKKNKENRNIIVQSNGEQIGLLVDSICDVISVRQAEIEPEPANITAVGGKYLQGVFKTEKGLIVILDIDEILKENC